MLRIQDIRSASLAAALLLLLSFAVPAGAEEIEWHAYEQARDIANQTGKPLMIEFYSPKCPFCKAIEEITFNDSTVITASGHFVNARVNVDENSSEGFKIWALPTLVFMYPNGTEINRSVGYKKPEEMLGLMQKAGGFGEEVPGVPDAGVVILLVAVGLAAFICGRR